MNLLPHQTPDDCLELTILGSVDQRIDTAADKHQDRAEVVEPAGDIGSAAWDEIQDEVKRTD